MYVALWVRTWFCPPQPAEFAIACRQLSAQRLHAQCCRQELFDSDNGLLFGRLRSCLRGAVEFDAKPGERTYHVWGT